ncbi:MAG: carboxypeptidase regulatory-like domain-containing protein, partial [Bryobacterales bacterium]|nr:carboxypeptidase regulatory-like domain-containing protein [Bryobacterales bacterium]
MRRILSLLLIALLAAIAAFSQSTASIVGTVTDSSGGAVPGARVAAVNIETGLRVQRESAADGSYKILLLPFGDYRLEVEREGFQRYSRSGIRLAVGDIATLDVTLVVGSLSESVTVTDAAPLLETQTGTVRGVVDQQRIVNLPLNGRRVTQLMTIQAGVIQRSS